MAEPLFFSQKKLEAWIDAGEVTFQDNVLTLLTRKIAYKVDPAVQVRSLIDGKDQKGLLGKTFKVSELTAMGAEHYAGTIILGDTGYECEEGFVGHQQGGAIPAKAGAPLPPPKPIVAAPLAKPASAAPAPKPAAPAPAKPTEPQSDMDLLTDFLLKNTD